MAALVNSRFAVPPQLTEAVTQELKALVLTVRDKPLAIKLGLEPEGYQAWLEEQQPAAALEERAMALGAIEHVLVDAKQDFFDTVIRHLIAGNVLRGNTFRNVRNLNGVGASTSSGCLRRSPISRWCRRRRRAPRGPGRPRALLRALGPLPCHPQPPRAPRRLAALVQRAATLAHATAITRRRQA